MSNYDSPIYKSGSEPPRCREHYPLIQEMKANSLAIDAQTAATQATNLQLAAQSERMDGVLDKLDVMAECVGKHEEELRGQDGVFVRIGKIGTHQKILSGVVIATFLAWIGSDKSSNSSSSKEQTKPAPIAVMAPLKPVVSDVSIYDLPEVVYEPDS